MPTTPVLSVAGAKELRRELKRAGADLGDLTEANRQVAAVALREAQRRAPVGKVADRWHRPGRLKGSLKAVGTQASAIVRSSGRSAPYGPANHWGWPKRKGRRGSGIKASLFVVEAVQAVEDDITTQYLRAVEAAVAKIRNH